MKKSLVILLFFIPLMALAQGRIREQLGFLLGGSYYYGDLSHNHFDDTQLAFGVFYRRNHKNFRVADRINFAYGKGFASDYDSQDGYISNRNLGFISNIFELGYQVEIHFQEYDVGALKSRRHTPYLFGGISYFYMNPKRQGEKLKDWRTEGQGVTIPNYSRHQISIPFGIGYKANLSNRIAIGVEYGFRKTFTDYLDDVSGVYADREIMHEEVSKNWHLIADPSIDGSDNTGKQRGNSKDKDWYSIFGLVITFQLNQNCGCAI